MKCMPHDADCKGYEASNTQPLTVGHVVEVVHLGLHEVERLEALAMHVQCLVLHLNVWPLCHMSTPVSAAEVKLIQDK